MRRKKARPLPLALIISAVLIIEFSVILKKCDSDKGLRESFDGGSVSASEQGGKENSGTSESLIFTRPYDSISETAGYSLAVENICQNPELPTGCEVTALTSALRFYGLPADKAQEAEDRYMALFRIFYKHRSQISRINLWGICDANSWLNDWPIKGRTNYPLLFDRHYVPKPIVQKIINLYQ